MILVFFFLLIIHNSYVYLVFFLTSKYLVEIIQFNLTSDFFFLILVVFYSPKLKCNEQQLSVFGASYSWAQMSSSCFLTACIDEGI